MTCRDEMLAAFDRLERRHRRSDFEMAEVVREVKSAGTRYAESTIRTHVGSRLCSNAPSNHAVTYDDLERTDRGWYRRKR